MEISVNYMWFIAGIVMLVAEIMGASGVGFMFAGLGALCVGSFITMGWIGMDDSLRQFVFFFATTALWAVILWKPMRRFYSGSNKHGYKNMVGETAYIGSKGLTKGSLGEATWSGTIMQATLVPDASVERLEAGTQVTIVDVSGVTLIVKPKA